MEFYIVYLLNYKRIKSFDSEQTKSFFFSMRAVANGGESKTIGLALQERLELRIIARVQCEETIQILYEKEFE
jgi:hypothetical protein